MCEAAAVAHTGNICYSPLDHKQFSFVGTRWTSPSCLLFILSCRTDAHLHHREGKQTELVDFPPRTTTGQFDEPFLDFCEWHRKLYPHRLVYVSAYVGKMMQEVTITTACEAQFAEQMSEEEILACLVTETKPTLTVRPAAWIHSIM